MKILSGICYYIDCLVGSVGRMIIYIILWKMIQEAIGGEIGTMTGVIPLIVIFFGNEHYKRRKYYES